MFTVSQLQPNITDIEWLKKNNLKVGCDGDSFVRKYMENVLHFKPENIVNVDNEYNYPGQFESNNISAAFLELPYEKVFLKHYCKGYTATVRNNRFGGLGFVSTYSKITPSHKKSFLARDEKKIPLFILIRDGGEIYSG